MTKQDIKTEQEVKMMAEGGRKLARIREALVRAVKPGMTSRQLDKLADDLINQSGGEASFKKVPGYKHATCINVNEVVVHGIPGDYQFRPGDKVGIDVGLFCQGFHTDTSTTVLVAGGNKNPEKERFLEIGRKGLKLAISRAKPGNRVVDISAAMQETVEAAGFSAIRALTGHGVGRELHEEPAVPCFVLGPRDRSPKLVPGMVLAIEIMYNQGSPDVAYKNDDGWTIVTVDGKISGLFEETVAVTRDGPVILTQAK